MRKELILPFLVLGLLYYSSCTNAKKNKDERISQDAVTPSCNETRSTDGEPEYVILVRLFLKWYQVQYDQITAFPLIKTTGSGKSERYCVNHVNTEVYLKLLSESGFLSDSYIAKKKDYFLVADNHLKENPQNDGPPVGFEYDLLLLTQEAYYFLDNPENIAMKILDESQQQARVLVADELVFVVSISEKKILDIIRYTENL